MSTLSVKSPRVLKMSSKINNVGQFLASGVFIITDEVDFWQIEAKTGFYDTCAIFVGE